jgi:hypothetical protein
VPDVVGSDVQNVLLPSTAGTLDRLERSGNILQVVEGSTSTLVSVGTSTFSDTGLSASITPSSSSNKILVIVNQMYHLSRSVVSMGGGIRLLRDSTVIQAPSANSQGSFELYIGSSSDFYNRATITKLDSPATTSSITYKTQGIPYFTADNGSMNFQVSNTVNGTSYITLMEVAA